MELKSLIIVLTLVKIADHVEGLPNIGTQLRIINGSNADVGEFPFMAALYYKGYYTCGCTILTNTILLTAAHCLYGRDKNGFSVLTGTNDLDDPKGIENKVNQVIMHENYRYTDNQPNDIALIRVLVTIKFDNMTQPVVLSTPSTDPPPGSTVLVMGWGYNKDKGNPMQYLQYASINAYSNPICDEVYEPYGIGILPTHLCAGEEQGGKGQCTGDSGGPVVERIGDTITQVGIISFSAKPCGIEGFPGVNTRVSSYMDWIKTKTYYTL